MALKPPTDPTDALLSLESITDTVERLEDVEERLAVLERGQTRLRYAPPTQTSPTAVNVGTSFFSGTYGNTEDVILTMPGSARTGDFETNGGRHIRVIGGAGTNTRMMFKDVRGSVYIEGLALTMTAAKDAFYIYGAAGTTPDIYLQNCRVIDVQGTIAGTHGDMVQFAGDGPVGRIFMDKFTGTSNCQGLFMPIQGTDTITSAELSRIDLAYRSGGDPTTYLLWFRDDQNGTPYPVTLENIWVSPRSGQNIAQHAIWPASGTAGGIGAVNNGDGTASWPSVNLITGYVTSGIPPSSFVPSTSAGLNYVSPGYNFPSPTG